MIQDRSLLFIEYQKDKMFVPLNGKHPILRCHVTKLFSYSPRNVS